MTAWEYYERRCPYGRGQMFGKTVLDPEGRAGVIVMSEWGPGNNNLILRLRPPGKPEPELRFKDGRSSPFQLFTLAELETDVIEWYGEFCWKAPAAECLMPKRQPVWS